MMCLMDSVPSSLIPPALRDAGVTTRFGILGPLEITAGSGPGLVIGGRKQRELLCLLILHRNRAVSASRLVAELWGDEAPKGAEVTCAAMSRICAGVWPAWRRGSGCPLHQPAMC
jgi:hypothetical protein